MLLVLKGFYDVPNTVVTQYVYGKKREGDYKRRLGKNMKRGGLGYFKVEEIP